MKRLTKWLAQHPLAVTLAAIVVVAGPGYYRQEQATNEAHDAAVAAQEAAARSQVTADAYGELLLRLEAERAERRHELCERDVADQQADRAMWIYVTEVLLVPPSDKVLQARAALDEIHPPLECNAEDVPVPRDG